MYLLVCLLPGVLVGSSLWYGIVSLGWFTAWGASREFPMDMAGFAVNLTLLLQHPKVEFDIDAKRGYQESSLLHHLVTLDTLQPKADNCTKVRNGATFTNL